MSIPSAMVSLLLDDAAVAALIDDQMFGVAWPSNPTKPFIVWRRVSGAHNLLSAPTESTPYYMTRLQFDIWADTIAECEAIYAACADLLYRYDGTVDGQVIIDTKIDLSFNTYDADMGLHRLSFDVQVYHLNE